MPAKHTRQSPATSLRSADVELLDEPERRQLKELARRMGTNGTSAQAVGDVLPQAVVLRNRLDAQLPKSFVETTEKAIQFSVQRDSSVLSDALFVVIGPAIRKAIAAFLREVTANLNRAFERTLSPRSLGWRIKALRTHRSFAEVLLQETVVYRVEHVFLIHRTTGILLGQASTPRAVVSDPDMVTAMLGAVQEYVRDSLKLRSPESLQSIAVGDYTIWVESGPQAVIALVINGTPPPELRWKMQDVLETVHLQKAEELAGFSGDTEPFSSLPQSLEACLQTQYKDEGRKFPVALAAVAAVPLIALLVLLGLSIGRSVGYARYVRLLKAEPGIVVVDTGRHRGKLAVYGLRDPLARDPAAIATEAGIEASSVELQLSPYSAYLDDFVLERARALLKPPASVTLSFSGGVLRAEGEADPRWIASSRTLALAINGVSAFQASGASVDDEPAIRALRESVEGTSLRFGPNSAELIAGQESVILKLASDLGELAVLLADRGLELSVTVNGHSAGIIADPESVAVSLARAERAVAELRPRVADAVALTAASAGVCLPATTERTEADRAANRRVSFSVATELTSR